MHRRAVLLITVGLLLVLGTLWAQTRVQTNTIVRTQRLEVLDAVGRIRAEIKTSGEDTLAVLYDGQGRLRTVIGTDGITMYGTDGKVRVKVSAIEGDSPKLHLRDSEGKEQVFGP